MLQLLLVLASIGGLAGSALVLAPRVLLAESSSSGATGAAAPEHQLTIELLAALLSSCHEIVAVYPRRNSSFLDAVIWLQDAQEPGVVNDGELALLSHSRVSQTIMLTILPESLIAADPVDQQVDWSFRDRWRSSSSTESHLLARQVSDLRIGPAPGAKQQDRVEIALTWADRTADGADKASVVVDAPCRAWK